MDIGGRRKRLGRRSRSDPDRREWVGGRLVSPFYITEGTPYRPELILWLELPEDVVVLFSLSNRREAPASFGATLLEAMESPLIGPPRRPDTFRVADAGLAAEVRQVLPGARVVVAPTPELHHVLELMSEAASKDKTAEDRGGEEPSYFESGRVGNEAVEALFLAARVLFRAAPWKVAEDSQILRVDIPAYGVEGACLSIIGSLGESLGLVLFPSIEGFERFLDVADARRHPGTPIDIGTTVLSLDLEAGGDLPASMYREALKHGWPVADPRAYPMVRHRDRDGVQRPLTERDVRVMSACAASLAAFFVKHRRLFKLKAFEPICESYYDEDDLEVRFTLPYEAGQEFAVNKPRRPRRGAASRSAPAANDSPVDTHRLPATGRQGALKAVEVGRNQPCPCGSGKKYKHCCLAGNRHPETVAGKQPTPPDAEVAPAASHNLDGKLVARLEGYARDRFGPNWMQSVDGVFRDPTPPGALLGPWALHHHLFGGKPIAQWFLEDHGVRLPGIELSWLKAQRAAWLSIWEVLDVQPGRSLTLRDLITDETRVVQEVAASKSLVKRDAVLARVVDHQGVSVLCGVYPRPLPPWDAAAVVEQTQGRLRRKSSVPVDRMRAEPIGRYLITRWEEALENVDTRALRPPALQNTDGDPLLITVDHFAFDPADRMEIHRRLAAAEEVQNPPDADDPELVYVFCKSGNKMHRGWERTITGTALVSGNALRVESNSIVRADSMRKRLEGLLGPLVSHRIREHADPVASFRKGGRAPNVTSPAPAPPPDEINRIILEMKTKDYADWADHPIPALGGKTARAAVRTKAGRQKVDTLLKMNENLESRLPPGQRFDFLLIRRELGLEE